MGKVREAPLSQAHGRVRKEPARRRGRGARRIREVGWPCCPGALIGRLLLWGRMHPVVRLCQRLLWFEGSSEVWAMC